MIKPSGSQLIILVSLAVSAGIWIIATANQRGNKNLRVSYSIFLGSQGWGYDILVNDSVFIHQESVPAMAGEKGFPSKMQAEQAAQLIINKMKRRRLPSVTTFEMEQILRLNDPQHGQPGKSK